MAGLIQQTCPGQQPTVRIPTKKLLRWTKHVLVINTILYTIILYIYILILHYTILILVNTITLSCSGVSVNIIISFPNDYKNSKTFIL